MKFALKSAVIPCVILFVLTSVAYLPVLRGGFVWDDDVLITDNPMVKASDGLYRFWFTTEAPDYYPLTSTLWWLEWRLWGDRATGYHVVNVLLQAANAVLVWLILKRLKIPGAWLAGLVFAIHPVNVATVAWISEQKNTLSMLFYLAAILLYLRFDEQSRSIPPQVQRWRSPAGAGWYALSLAAFFLAVLSKAAVVMLPVVLLGCVWWRHGRVQGKDLLRSLPFFALSLALGIVSIWFQFNRVLKGSAVQTNGFLGRLVVAGCVPWFYLEKALLPVDLTVIYSKWQIDPSLRVSYMPGAALLGCFLVFWWKRRSWGRPFLFGLGCFVVMLLPVMGFFDQHFYIYSFVADHWQYYSIVGVIALAVAGWESISHRTSEPHRHLWTLAGVVVALVLVGATWKRSAVYVDQETLWRDNVAKNPAAWLAQYNLGAALTERGETEEAIQHYEQALRINPDYAGAHNNLGNALLQIGRMKDANAHFQQALRIKPDFAEAEYNFGNALAQEGRVREAVKHWEQALRIRPDYAEAHYNLGTALAQMGKLQEAIAQYEQALQSKPDYALAHYNLGVALEQAGRPQDALGHYQQALRIKPGFVMAQERLERLRAAP